MNLPKNVGKTDRTIRLAVAGLLVLVGVFGGNAVISLIGLVVLMTGYFGTCPAYIALKIDTNKGQDD